MAIDITQAAAFVGTFAWTAGDPVSLSFRVNANWAGVYKSQVRKLRTPTAVLVGSLTVATAWDTLAYPLQTLFTLTMSEANSLLIPTGKYFVDVQQTNGVTRIWGNVRVDPQVTVF